MICPKYSIFFQRKSYIIVAVQVAIIKKRKQKHMYMCEC